MSSGTWRRTLLLCYHNFHHRVRYHMLSLCYACIRSLGTKRVTLTIFHELLNDLQNKYPRYLQPYLATLLYNAQYVSSLTNHCRALISKPHILLQLFVQFAFRSVLQDEVNTCVVVEIAVHTQDVWMPKSQTNTQFSTCKSSPLYYITSASVSGLLYARKFDQNA